MPSASYLPSFGATLAPKEITTVARDRDLSLPFCRDVQTAQQMPSTGLCFKNTPNFRTQAIFFYSNDDLNNWLSDIEVETQSFTSVSSTPRHQSYGQKIADTVLRMLGAMKSFGRKIIRHH